jgi:AcrR family transcriptional regulator
MRVQVPLDRDRVVAAALSLADREGIERLTLRRLAERLGCSPMGLYTYFETKSQLLDAMVDAVFARLPSELGSGTVSWQTQLRHAFGGFRQVLRSHPGVVPLVVTRGAFGDKAQHAEELLLRMLLDAGIDPTSAVRCYYALFTFTVGNVVLELSRAPAAERRGRTGRRRRDTLERHYRSLSPNMFPVSVELAPLLAAFGDDVNFEHGIEAIITAVPEPAG